MSRLDIRHLMVIEAIAKSRTLTEAAGRLQITPSALSHRLSEAERRLGRPIMKRGGLGPKLTETGEHLLAVTSELLPRLDQIERAQNPQLVLAPLVRVALSTIGGYAWLPALVNRLERGPTPVDVEVCLEGSLDPIGAVRCGVVDLGLVPVPIRDDELRATQVLKDEMVAVMAREHPLARHRWLEAQHFVSESYVTDGMKPQAGREFERFFQPAGLEPARILRAGSTEGVIALVAAGLGVAILTRLALAPYRSGDSVVARKLGPRGVRVRWNAVYRRANDESSSAIEHVVSCLAEVGDVLGLELLEEPREHPAPSRAAAISSRRRLVGGDPAHRAQGSGGSNKPQ